MRRTFGDWRGADVGDPHRSARARSPYRTIDRVRRVALVGFCGAVASGFAMFSIRAADHAALPVFLAKMTLIGLAAVNFAVYLSLERRGAVRPRRFAAALSLAL